MRPLFCTTDGAGAFNGINAWLLEFLPALNRAGLKPQALVFSWSPEKACFTAPRLAAAGIPTRVVFPMLYHQAAVRRCQREIVRHRADIFVANHVFPALHAMPAARRRGVPGISMLNNDDEEYRAKAVYPADATVAVSKRLLELIPDDNRLARCIPYGVPLSARLARPVQPGEAFRLVYHGRIAKLQKRILETTAALVRLCSTHQNLRADLYGSGPDEAELRELLSTDDAQGRVRYLGPRDSLEIRRLLPDYHASVLLSDFEGMPVSVLESMSAGLVPICLRTQSGLPELIQPGANGLLVEDRAENLDQAVLHLARDPDRWTALSREAHETVRRSYSTDVCARAWIELLNELTQRPPRTDSAPPPRLHPALSAEYRPYPGALRAVWRWLRFGQSAAPRPW